MNAVLGVVRRAMETPLAVARRMVAVAALLKLLSLAPALIALSQSDALRFPVAHWLPALPGSLILPLMGAWTAAALAFLWGSQVRWAGVVLTFLLAVALISDQQVYSNHLYLLTTLVGLLTLAEGRWVVRPILLLRLQATIVYGFAAVTKINLPYISGGVLNAYLGQPSLIAFPDGLRTPLVMASLAFLSILVEGVLAVGLWSRRWRTPTMILGVSFHVTIVLLLETPLQLTVFAFLMFSLYVLHAANIEEASAGSGP